MAKMTVKEEPAPQPPQKEPTPPTSGASVGRSTGRGYSEPYTRPDHIKDKSGSFGTPIKVMSNFIALKNRPECALYQYHVTYDPPIDSKRLRSALIYSKEDLIGKTRSFDGMVLYLPNRLKDDVTTYTCKLKDESTVKVTITLTNELNVNSPTCIHLFNIIFRRILQHLGMMQIGRHYYNSNTPIAVPQHKLELWPGFITSILQYDAGVLLCADVSHKILRQDTVWDFLDDLYRSRRGNFHENATKTLIGEIVLTRYNNKTYRIDDINWEANPSQTFKTRDGSDITFADYYKKHYDIKIEDKEQPMLVSRPSKREIRARGGDESPILLVPELCTRTGLSEEARADFRIMRDLAEHTRVDPTTRYKSLRRFIDQVQTLPDSAAELKNWKLEFAKDLVTYGARVLPQEKIYQKDKTLNYRQEEADWSRDMRGSSLISAVHLSNYIIYCTKRDSSIAEEFYNTLRKVCPPMGIKLREPQVRALDNDRTDTFLRALNQDLTLGHQVQMVICVLPNNRKERYDAIKKLCCKGQGAPPVLSQCILSKTLSKQKQLMSVSTKVAMQLNCKMGGELWALEIPIKSCMVVGVDTYHDSSRRGRSVGGFIASTNQTLTKYYSQTMFQSTGQELADNLKVCMASALRYYHELNQTLPDRIILYRDGVGDGQLAAVVEHEIPQIIESFAAHGGSYRPRFAVIVVKKRISARIFRADKGLSNPPPGTVVDNTITKPEWYDFFLVSQSVRQGTVTPTHFNVVHDTSGLKPDHMQKLTYKLCHLYYNWPGTVRVPAPCQYAHKLAFLVGQSIHDTPSKELDNKLYYL